MCGGTGYIKSNCQQTVPRCFICGSEGRKRRDCPQKHGAKESEQAVTQQTTWQVNVSKPYIETQGITIHEIPQVRMEITVPPLLPTIATLVDSLYDPGTDPDPLI